jgi:deoxyribose-phosphate aldolase
MSYTAEQIAAALDLAVLKPTATAADVRAACALAVARKIKSVCVAPAWVPMASDLYDNICAVIAFPHGNTLPEAKYAEAVAAMDCGAKELDVVVNYGRFLDSGNADTFWDIAAIVKAAHPRGVLVKPILETCFYTPDQIREACRLCVKSGVDFVKTSTGFGPGGATPEAVKAMLEAVDGEAAVKASGGIKTYADAALYLDLGCTRIGASTYRGLLP